MNDTRILQFPQTVRGQRRRREGMSAAGLLALMLIDRAGEEAPANVERFDRLDDTPPIARSPELLLAMLLWSALPPKKRENIRGAIRAAAYGGDDPSAVQLHKMLNGGR